MLKINDALFGNETFKNNEVIYKEVPLEDDINTITMVFENNKDIADLMFAAAYIRSEKPAAKLELNMPYLPYSRMDRKINEQVFSLKLFAEMLNAMHFSIVRVIDPHSEVSGCINNLYVVPIEHIVATVAAEVKADVILFPDAGSRRKYTQVYRNICEKYPVIYAEKVRDLKDRGRILSSKIVDENGLDLNDKTVLIVDDICVGGRTFQLASEALKEKGVKDVYLWVAHCENAVFDSPLLPENHIKHIYTTDSIIRKKEDTRITAIHVVCDA